MVAQYDWANISQTITLHKQPEGPRCWVPVNRNGKVHWRNYRRDVKSKNAKTTTDLLIAMLKKYEDALTNQCGLPGIYMGTKGSLTATSLKI